MKLSSRVASFVIAFAASTAVNSSRAGLYTYRISGPSAWNTSSNWDKNSLPTAADLAMFPSISSGSLYQPINCTVYGMQNVRSLDIDTHGVFSLDGDIASTLHVGGDLTDYTFHDDTPAAHAINVANLSVGGAIDVGANANLTISSRISGGLQKRGYGVLALTNPDNNVGEIDVVAGTVTVPGDVLPFRSWAEYIRIHDYANFQVQSSCTLQRPIKLEAGGAAANLVINAGQTVDLPRGFWGFTSLNVIGGGSVHTVNAEFTQLQDNRRQYFLNIAEGSTMSVDKLSGDPDIALNQGTLVINAVTATTGSIVLATDNSVNTIDTNGLRMEAFRVVGTASNITFNKNGAGELYLNNPTAIAGVTTINLNGGTLSGSLAGAKQLNMSNDTRFVEFNDDTTTAAVRVNNVAYLDVPRTAVVTMTGAGLQGNGEFHKEGTGTLKLQTSASSLIGELIMDGGRLELQSAGGSQISRLLVNSGTAAIMAPNQLGQYASVDVFGTLELATPSLGTAPVQRNLTFGVYANGSIHATQSIDTGNTRAIYISGGTASINVDGGKTLTVSGQISGDSALQKNGHGDLVLTAMNVYSGNTFVNEGRLILAHPRDQFGATLANGSYVTIESPATLKLGAIAGQNNVIGTGDLPSNIARLNLHGTLDTASGTTHNLGEVNLFGGLIYGSATPLAGWADYTLNSAVNVDTTTGGSYIVAPGGVNLRNQITFDVNASPTFSDSRRLEISAKLANEPGSLGSLRKIGDGTAYLSGINTYSGGTLVQKGKLIIAPTGKLGPGSLITEGDDTQVSFEPGRTSPQKLLWLGIDPQSSVDLGNNDLILTADSYDSVITSIKHARNNGSWNAGGLTSSAAKSDPQHRTTLGVLGGADFLWNYGSLLHGTPVSSTDIVVKYAYYGDTNFSGTVDSTDFNAFLAGYGATSGGKWASGDFDYDGKVNTLDFNQLAGNFGASALTAPSLGATVPEPSSGISLLLGMTILRYRRRTIKTN